MLRHSPEKMQEVFVRVPDAFAKNLRNSIKIGGSDLSNTKATSPFGRGALISPISRNGR
jgi:hypothetical protein